MEHQYIDNDVDSANTRYSNKSRIGGKMAIWSIPFITYFDICKKVIIL